MSKTTLQKVLVSQIDLWEHNPADRSQGKIQTLADSIKTQGLLQNLVLRVHPQDPERFQVICGERRTRALKHLIETGQWPVDQTIQAVVHHNLSNAEGILIALTENLERQEMNPLEKLRALKSAIDQGADYAEVAESLNITPLRVQQRIAILDRCSEEMLEAIAKGIITPVQASVIAAAPEPLRQDLFTEAKAGKSSTALQAMLKTQSIPTSVAIFPLEGHQSNILSHLFDSTPDTFQDHNLFFAAQLEAVKERVSQYSDRKIPARYLIAEPDYKSLGLIPDPTNPPQQIIIYMNMQTGEVTEHPLKSKPVEITPEDKTHKSSQRAKDFFEASTSKDSSTAPGKPTTPQTLELSDKAFEYIDKIRTLEVQKRLQTQGTAGQQMQRLMILMLLALVNQSALWIRVESLLPSYHKSSEVVKNIRDLGAAPDLYSLLSKMPTAEFAALFVQVMSSLVFSQKGKHAALFSQIFTDLGLVGATYFTLTQEFLELFKKEELWLLAQSMPIKTKVKLSGKHADMVSALLEVAPQLYQLGWMPPGFEIAAPLGTLPPAPLLEDAPEEPEVGREEEEPEDDEEDASEEVQISTEYLEPPSPPIRIHADARGDDPTPFHDDYDEADIDL